MLTFSDICDRALEVEEASDDPPERIAMWLDTVSTTALGAQSALPSFEETIELMHIQRGDRP